ncbi:hypothetical protein JL720_10311 [Aureococcus anophagefferens]|nr:hypothetical protein JL720_10311 [Aureococcus anophagefferens]
MAASPAGLLLGRRDGKRYARRQDIVRGVAGRSVFSVFNRGLQGPTRRVALGDVVEVRVTNNRPSGLTLHHHGIHQVGTPYNDGASMVTQAPVAPGGSMAYRFVAEPAGTHWYHGHAGTDAATGCGASSSSRTRTTRAAYPGGAVMVADVYATQTTYEYVLKFNYNPLNKEVGYDAQAKPSVGTLLNGLADFRAAAPRQAVRARLLCGAADRQAYVKPVAATKRGCGPGARRDRGLFRDAEGAEVVLGFRELEHGEKPYNGTISGPVARSSRGRGGGTNQGRTVSFNRVNATFVVAPARPDAPPMVAAPAAGTDHQWGDEDLDLLFPAKFRLDTRFNPSPPARAADGRYGVERDAHYGTNVVDVPLGAVVDIVVVNNGLGSAPVQHPLHLHGYRFWVVDHGPLPYPENDAAAPRYNLDDPPYVDTFPVDTGFYAVLRFVADNPGMWHFHCHYLIHMVNGLSLVLNVGEDAQPEPPRAWWDGQTYGGYACGAAADVAASPGSNTNS